MLQTRNRIRSLLRSATIRASLVSLLFGLPHLLPTASAQGIRPSGSFGFQINAWVGPDGRNPQAVIGVLNFDGAGKVTGSFTIAFAQENPGPNDPPSGLGIPGALTGTYSSNPDGTGKMNIGGTIGPISGNVANFNSTLAMVITDGGAGLQLVQTDPGGQLNSGTARAIGTVSGIPPNTSYGFQINKWTIFGGQQGVRPEVIIGALTFDGAGKVTVPITDVHASQDPSTETFTASGTYSTNADGTGLMTLDVGGGQTVPIAMVITDSGAACYLMFTTDDPGRLHSGIARRQ